MESGESSLPLHCTLPTHHSGEQCIFQDFEGVSLDFAKPLGDQSIDLLNLQQYLLLGLFYILP